MKISKFDKNFNNYELIDLTTGKIIPNIIWANDEYNGYEILILDTKGNPKRDEFGEIITEIKIGKIKINKK